MFDQKFIAVTDCERRDYFKYIIIIQSLYFGVKMEKY